MLKEMGVSGMGIFTPIITIKPDGLSRHKVIMKQHSNLGQQGFILVWALLLMIVVTLLGVAGISTSIFEERMAANEALHQQIFF